MKDLEKKIQLKKYKTLATSLFLLMAVLFIVCTILQKSHQEHWIGYLRAFSEAAMVGALADWFAVTALFHYPMGLKIPHTNLIQNSKAKIGDNLGTFVVDNFLSPKNIRPYIVKLKVSALLGNWLSIKKNQDLLLTEGSHLVLDILYKLDDREVVHFIAKKAKEMSSGLHLNDVVGNGLEYLVEKQEHQRAISNLAEQIKGFISQNQEMVRERVKKESFLLIPKFVDDAVADKITNGLSQYFEEVAQDLNHPLRAEISKKLMEFAGDLKHNEKWNKDFDQIKDHFLQPERLNQYAVDIWKSIKTTIFNELSSEESGLKKYMRKNINELSSNLQNNEDFQNKIDHWVRLTSYKYLLRNTNKFGELISTTVGNWEGEELSRKLELEVGKDLQFIRINGTLVGGLVGLIIYTIAHFFI